MLCKITLIYLIFVITNTLINLTEQIQINDFESLKHAKGVSFYHHKIILK
jgi:hypothetical protein